MTRAFIINGLPNGEENKGRWDAALETCKSLGFECERSPAMYTSMSDYKDSCGNHDDASSDEKYVRGCMFAHFNAFSKIAKGSDRVIILEDDIVIPGKLSDTVDQIRTFTDQTSEVDLAYIGHCFGTQCTHAMAVTPEGARKIIKDIDWCGSIPVDNQLGRMCESGLLNCSYAPTNEDRAPDSWGDGLLHQSGAPVRDQVWFHKN